MIWVIGTSASVEYSIKAWYETVVGRITDTKLAITEEDIFNQKFTQDYVEFIKDRPWYEFDFKSRLKTLWTATPLKAGHFFRSLDRRYLLTSELFVKYGYGKLIGLGTKQIYEVALPTTAVLLDDNSLHQLPRYDKFANAMRMLARQGHSFKEVAGNNSAILLTVLAPMEKKISFINTREVFTQPIPSDAGMKRVALAVTVENLQALLLLLEREQITIEHLFDY